MDNAKKLSHSTTFNQQKILINDSDIVTIPSTSGLVIDEVVTVPTGLIYAPAYRVFFEYAGVMYQVAQYNWIQILALDTIITGIDADFNFVIKTVNLGSAVANVTFHYRIYLDSQP